MKKLTNFEKHKQFLPFNKAREFAHKLNLKKEDDWNTYSKSGNKPDNIPAYPREVYQKEWKGMPDFLGNNRIANQNRKFKSFEEARKFVRKLKLKTQREWNAYSKSGNRPDNIPSLPRRTYEKEWAGWGDWLGTGTVAPQLKEYWSYEKARNYVLKLGLKSKEDWNTYTKSGKLPKEIPADPREVYKEKGWNSWGNWLGTGRIANQDKEWLSWKEAKPLYQKIVKENKKI